MTPNIKLYRPVGQGELDLIAASGFKSFPPRLPEQTIFYPVLTKEYAERALLIRALLFVFPEMGTSRARNLEISFLIC